MFVINIYLKFALIALFLVGGIIVTILYGFGYSWILLLIGILLLASYFLLGTVSSAAQLLQESKFDEAETRLGLTKYPNLLYVTNRAFYYILSGNILVNKQNNKEAEAYFNKALELKLPSDNEKGMVLLQLASINANRNKWTLAKNYISEADKLTITENQIKTQLEMIKQAYKNRGQMKVAGRMGKAGHGMMQRSGKRRRPKMR